MFLSANSNNYFVTVGLMPGIGAGRWC
ncbi:hypothetical protein CHELA1G2_13426 [Hyphomicrobiales bacterium]|nr:hypothetical protein CHELA1G2_13426 [Hyphomicrobiales bacterium]